MRHGRTTPIFGAASVLVLFLWCFFGAFLAAPNMLSADEGDDQTVSFGAVPVTSEGSVIYLNPYFREIPSSAQIYSIGDGEPEPEDASSDGSSGGDAAVAPPSQIWLGATLRNDLAEPVERVLIYRQPVLSRAGLFGAPLGHQPIGLTAQLGGTTSTLLRPLESLAGEQAFSIRLQAGAVVAIAAQFTQAPEAHAFYLWQPEAYASYRLGMTRTQSLLLGVVLVMAALMLAFWIFAGLRFCFAAGLFSLTLLVFFMFSFGYLPAEISVGGLMPFYVKDASFAVIVVSGVGLALSLLTFDPSDQALRRTIVWCQYLAFFTVVVVFFGLPYAVETLKIVTLAAVLLTAYVVPRQMRKGMPGVRLSFPGWLLILLAYVAAVILSYTDGSALLLIAEPMVHGTAVLGTLLICFALATQANAGPFHSLGSRSGRRPTVEPKPSERLPIKAYLDDKRIPSAVDSYVSGLAAAKQGLWDWQIHGDKLFLSPFVAELLDETNGALPATEDEWFERIHPEDQKPYRDSLASYLALGNVSFNLVFRIRQANRTQSDRKYVPLEFKGQCLTDEKGRPERCVGVLTERHEVASESVKPDPYKDQLTEMANRDAFMAHLDGVVEASQKADAELSTETAPLLLLVDIDRFKSYNEALGQAQGDKILSALAERLSSVVGPEEYVARMGGDEFAVLVPPFAERSEAEPIAIHLQEALAPAVEIDGQELFPTATIGAAYQRDYHQTGDDFLADAQKALFEAKKSGGGKVQVYQDGMGEERGRSLVFETDLRRALDRYEMEVYFQPIMDLRNGRIAGFEALLRWNHPDRGLLGPDEFVAQAEQLGLITRLGRFALSMTSLQLSQWQQFFPLEKPLFASVNVSTKQLLGDELVSDMKEIMRSVNLAPGSLKLEVTESLLIENEEEASRILGALKELGGGLVLDDYGRGHSTLERLKQFPFDTIKIDRAFVSGLDQDDEAFIMVRSAIELARDLSIEVVAEGVETEAVGRKLYELGCGYAQGFVFGAPMTAMEAQAFIANYWKD